MKLLTFCPTKSWPENEVASGFFNQTCQEWRDILITRDNPLVYKKNIQHNCEKMRRIVLDQDYEKVWICESDTIPPRDALQKLLDVNAPVVTGLYILRHGAFVPNLFRFEESELFAGRMGGNIGIEGMKQRWGEIFRVSGGCTGCIVIDRSVLEGFSFLRNDDAAPDMGLMEHCCKEGIKQIARLDVVCGHKRPDGVIIWPDRETGYRLEVN